MTGVYFLTKNCEMLGGQSVKDCNLTDRGAWDVSTLLGELGRRRVITMEVVEPKRTGRKATAIMVIEVLVEVEESESFYDMEEQARVKLQKHVVEGNGFYPFRSHCETIHEMPINRVIDSTTINPRRSW